MTPAETWTHAFVNLNGLNLHYVTQGEGPLMLMLHGFPEFWYSWRHQIPEFAQDHKVVALDLRGYNLSDKPSQVADYAMELLVQDVAGVIRALGYERCTLVGHDWGGAIAWTFANRHEDMLDRLIVLNLPHPAKFAAGLNTLPQQLKSWYILFFQLPLLPEQLIAAGHCWILGPALKGSTGWPQSPRSDHQGFTGADIAAYREAFSQPGAVAAALNYYRAFWQRRTVANENQGAREDQAANQDQAAQWRKLQVPTLMIWGEQDLFLGKELSEGTEAYVANLQLHYLPDSGHWVQQEQPAQVNRIIRDFLAIAP
jgi:epoxide hydrolase 4